MVGLSDKQKRVLEQVARRKTDNARIIELSKDLDCVAPFDVLPEKMQSVIKEWEKAFPLPAEYYFGGVLAAFSCFVGNSIKIEYKPGWMEPAGLYMALVGPSSIGKTPALKKVLAPVVRREIALHEEYKNAMKVYSRMKRQAKDDKAEDPPQPLRREFAIDDFTTETIGPLLSSNPNGLIVTADELMGFIKNLGRYTSGSDMEFWLKVWSNESAKINRISRGSLFVKQAFATVIGGIQPKILNELSAGSNVDNGFVARMLFVLPANTATPQLTDYVVDKTQIDLYQDAVSFLLDQVADNFLIQKLYEFEYTYEMGVMPGKIEMTRQAKAAYLDYYNSTTSRMDQVSTEWERSALGKLRSYCLRFALILRIMDAAFDREEVYKIGSVSEYDLPVINLVVDEIVMDRAMKICNYFEQTMTGVVERVYGRKEEAIIKDLPENSRRLYLSLPDEFRTADGVKLASDYDIPERTFKRMLKDEKLFICESRGFYRKSILIDG